MGEDAISDQFVRQHYAGLQALLQRRIGDPAIAAEMLNEAVATAIVHARQGRVAQPERLAGYVFRVALNLYRNYRREFDNRAELRAAGDAIQQLHGSTADDGLEAGIVREVRAIVASLPTPRDREIVKRFYLDEEDKEQICQSLGLAPLHFDKVIFRARQRLRALLEARGFSKSDLLGVLLVCFV
ncbi:MAG TPA: sigma-70 family RNA polymerase sigma factor [Steroidobacteraceae bacterium]|nr:sigma-70 family RNA polymerase sigma factor [Steroidobacteraceae bacterium]